MAANEIILIPSVIGQIATAAWSKIEAAVRASTGSENMSMYYVHGTPLNIAERIIARATSPEFKNNRFPLVALVHNYQEQYDSVNYYSNVTLNIWLMNLGTRTSEYEKRYSENFVKVLYPLWQEFINTLARSGAVMVEMDKGIVHDKIDRPNWGVLSNLSNNAFVNGENLDGIELRLNLKLDYTNCLRLQKENQTITN